MFILALVQDMVRVSPEEFQFPVEQILRKELDSKLSNRVLREVGLCIAVYDLQSIGDGELYPSEGAAHHKVRFREIVFRPFVGEVMEGELVSMDREEGLRVSVGFFDDIVIPPGNLQEPYEFDEHKQVWRWNYGDGEDEDEHFVYELRHKIRFKVVAITFTQMTPTPDGDVQATQISESQAPINAAAVAAAESSATASEPATTSSAEGLGPPAKPAAAALAAGAAGAGAASAEGTGSGGADDGFPAPLLRRRSSSISLPPAQAPPVMQVVGIVNGPGLGMVSWWS